MFKILLTLLFSFYATICFSHSQLTDILPKNNIIYHGYKMPEILNSVKSINEMINNYDFYKKATKKRSKELNISKYISFHKKIMRIL